MSAEHWCEWLMILTFQKTKRSKQHPKGMKNHKWDLFNISIVSAILTVRSNGEQTKTSAFLNVSPENKNRNFLCEQNFWREILVFHQKSDLKHSNLSELCFSHLFYISMLLLHVDKLSSIYISPKQFYEQHRRSWYFTGTWDLHYISWAMTKQPLSDQLFLWDTYFSRCCDWIVMFELDNTKHIMKLF